MIHDVLTKSLKIIGDKRGWLMEVLRCDDSQFKQFGQVYVTAAYLDVVKAWHLHKKQTDNIACVYGKAILALYDAREESPTKGNSSEYIINENNRQIVTILPGIYHGFKAEDNIALLINIPDLPYDYKNPDEHRLPPDSKEISYKWLLKEGLVHG